MAGPIKNTLRLFFLVALNILEFNNGDSVLGFVPTNNNTSASSTPVIFEFNK